MAKEYGRVISIRIPEKLNDRIEAAIATGKYRNKADYVMAALRAFDDGLGEVETGGGVPTIQTAHPENDRGDSMEWQTRKDLIVLIMAGIIVFGLFAYTIYRENLNVKDYDLDLVYTDGLQTRFTIEFDADRPGVMTAELDGVGIPLNLDGGYSIEFKRGHNSIDCIVAGVGQSGTHLLNSIDFHFT